MTDTPDTVRVFPRKPRAAPCRERGKHIRRAYGTAPFSRRTTSSGIAFSLKDVCLSRAVIRGLSHGTLSSVGVVTTTANEKDAVCVHTTTHERKTPICAVFAVLQAASSQEQYRPIFWRLFFSFAPCLMRSQVFSEVFRASLRFQPGKPRFQPRFRRGFSGVSPGFLLDFTPETPLSGVLF